jgi:DNA-binding LytR/AlgR family response regulator
MGKASVLELCRTLLQIHPHTNVVFLTAYNEYALDAWDTEACGFLLKPVTPESVRQQLAHLRYPLYTGGLSR